MLKEGIKNYYIWTFEKEKGGKNDIWYGHQLKIWSD